MTWRSGPGSTSWSRCARDPHTRATTWKGFGDPALEKVIQAQPTFLDIGFLRRGVELGAAVCRLTLTMSCQCFYGTGIRIGDDLVLTN